MSAAKEKLSQATFCNEMTRRRARVRPECTPSFLTDGKPRFCVAMARFTDGRLTKVPTGLSGASIDITASTAGSCDLQKVLDQFQKDSRAIGIGLILPHDDILVLDFDHCNDGADWHPELKNFLQISKSYAEISSSGEGVHLFLRVRDAVNRFGNRRGVLNGLSIEQYTHKRYISCTFDTHPDAVCDVADGESILLKLASMGSARNLQGGQNSAMPTSVASIHYEGNRSPSMVDEQVLRLCRKARNSGKFKALFDHGDTCSYHFGDASRADQALLSMLAFYTQDPVQLERLFSESALAVRSKWTDRVDYRVRSIVAALGNWGETP